MRFFQLQRSVKLEGVSLGAANSFSVTTASVHNDVKLLAQGEHATSKYKLPAGIQTCNPHVSLMKYQQIEVANDSARISPEAIISS